jgi:hypothetical protein
MIHSSLFLNDQRNVNMREVQRLKKIHKDIVKNVKKYTGSKNTVVAISNTTQYLQNAINKLNKLKETSMKKILDARVKNMYNIQHLKQTHRAKKKPSNITMSLQNAINKLNKLRSPPPPVIRRSTRKTKAINRYTPTW